MVGIGIGVGLNHVLGSGEGATPLPALGLSISPAIVAENAGTTTGTVTRPADQTSGVLTVSLASDDTSEATVPASVDIPNGQQSADFTITILNENLDDGDQIATISASATDYNGASASVTVTDVGVSTFNGINSIAISDMNWGDGSLGTSGEPFTFTDQGSLGGVWTNFESPHRLNISAENGIYRVIADGRSSDGDRSYARADASNYFDGSPTVDVFMILVAGSSGLSPTTMRYCRNPDFAAVDASTSITNLPGTTVNGVDAVNAGDAFNLIDGQGAVIVRIPNYASLSSNNPRIGPNLSSQYPRLAKFIRWVAIPSADVAANLADIVAELQATVDAFNGV
jgi:hypothetical protein